MCGHLIDDIFKVMDFFFRGGGRFWGLAWGTVLVACIVVCQVSVVLSKYESNVIINKDGMAI